MKIRIFQSDKGDCLLISSGNKNILVDAGISSSYTEHVAPTISKLKQIDLLCVSHIDDDHIGGILKMIEDMVDWKVFDFHAGNGSKVKEPKSFRPPKISQIWHNAFSEFKTKNQGDIENMLAAVANIMSSSEIAEDHEIGGVAFSKSQAIQLSQRLKPGQLGIPLNKDFNGKMVMIKKMPKIVSIGNLKLTILAPFEEDLDKLRGEWNAWLDDNKEAVQKIRDKVKGDSAFLGNSEVNFLIALSTVLGDRKKVTAPNLASIMFLVEENGKTVLMTGDGHSKDIIKGLKSVNRINSNGGLHVDVLKVQHHGSDHNIDTHFCETISADHYIFCGNGSHSNPELKVIELIVNSRIGTDGKQSINGKNNKSFTLWFNSDEMATKPSNKMHMREIENLVKGFSSSKVKFKFMPKGKSFMDLAL